MRDAIRSTPVTAVDSAPTILPPPDMILAGVARAMIRSRSAAEAAQAVFPALTASTGWPVAALWLAGDDRREYRCEAFFGTGPEVANLRTRCLPTPICGAGVAGGAATSGVGWHPLDRSEERYVAALDCGFSSVLAAPLGTSQTMFGMVEMFGPQQRVPDGAVLEVVGGVAAQFELFVERSRAVAALADAETRIRAIVDAALDAFVAIDAQGRIEEFNRAAERIFGYRREEVLGRSVAEVLIPTSLRPFHEESLARCTATGQSRLLDRRVRLTGLRRDGSQVPIEMEVHRLPGREPLRFLAFLRDITDADQVQQALVEAGQRYAEQARALQRSLLPASIPPIAGMDVAVRYQPAGDDTEVGGDFYDLFENGEDGWSLVVGDVEGKGLEAAAVTTLARFTIRAVAHEDPDPGAVLSALNQAIIVQRPGRLCTVVYARLVRHRDGFQLTVGSAGHPLPLRLTNGTIETIGVPGVMLGVLDSIVVETQTVHLEPGDVVVFYTDGVSEAGSPHGELFGDEGVERVLDASAGSSASAVADRLGDALGAFQTGRARDDVALMVLGVPPA